MMSGERGVNYTVQSSEPTLNTALEWRNVGWAGAGWGEVCVEEWEALVRERRGPMEELSFEVIGRSVLFETVVRSTHTFVLFSSNNPTSSSRQITPPESDCNPALWDTSVDGLYGIQTFPSAFKLLPPSLRSSPFTITTKTLSPCSSIGMVKEMLLPFVLNWTFLEPIPEGLADVDPNDWSIGSRLVIPSEYIEDRESFPMNEPVTFQVLLLFVSFFLKNSFYCCFVNSHCDRLLLCMINQMIQRVSLSLHRLLCNSSPPL